jgi:hypothetical protein
MVIPLGNMGVPGYGLNLPAFSSRQAKGSTFARYSPQINILPRQDVLFVKMCIYFNSLGLISNYAGYTGDLKKRG